ncbi:hypothetical protein ES703_109593 [subsurface metagenome]
MGPPGPAGGYGDVLLIGVMERAAFRLLATQNEDGGWEWLNPDTKPGTGMDDWYGFPVSPANTRGVTAQGMLDMYKLTQNPHYLNACIRTYEGMEALTAYPEGFVSRIRGPDILFLVELSEVTGVSTYADFAKTRYDTAVGEFGSLAVLVKEGRIGQEWPALISWDINLYVQGALALDRYFPGQGYDAQAAGMVEVLYQSLYGESTDFDITSQSQPGYWLAVTGALEAFVTTGTHPDKAAILTTNLLANQRLDGSFISGSDGEFLQPTAYAVMALIKVSGCDRAVISAVNYLIGCQGLNGGWLEGGIECTEVGSEVAQAIYDYIK